jgi:hypothetical protein
MPIIAMVVVASCTRDTRQSRTPASRTVASQQMLVGDLGDNDGVDSPLPENEVEVGAVERAVPRLVENDVARR